MTLCLLRFATATILAHLGIARAQCALALIYFVGECVSRDPAKAAHWSSKAASQGNARGQLLLRDFKLIDLPAGAKCPIASESTQRALDATRRFAP